MAADFTPVSRKSDIIAVAATALVFFAVSLISDIEKALAFAVVFGVFLSIVQTKKRARGNYWFWAALITLAVIHIVALTLIDIPGLSAGIVVLPVAIVDGFLMYGLLNWIERLAATRESKDDAG